jgi:RHS repeat-associated protein
MHETIFSPSWGGGAGGGGLINMNGRLYDPLLARMLSPDNYVQAAGNTQSYNRYSYCVNNPLKYTDPSGEFIPFVAVVVIVGVVSGGINLATNWEHVNSFGDAAYYFGIGAAVGAAATVGGAALAPIIGTGAIAGAVLGGAGGFVTGYANTGYTTGDWGKTALNAGGNGAIIGAVGGAIIAGGIAGLSGRNIWSGAAKVPGTSSWSFDPKDVVNGPSFKHTPEKITTKDFWKYGRNLRPTVEAGRPEIANTQPEDGWNRNYVSDTKKSLGLPDELQYTDDQIGKKFGSHMNEFSNKMSHSEYLQRAQQIYQNPNQIIHYPEGAIPYGGETHFMQGGNLLRIDNTGFFRSLYPIIK